MPTFTIETPNGKKLRIEAPDEAQAMAGAQQWHAEQSAAPAAAPQPESAAAAAPTGPSDADFARLGIPGPNAPSSADSEPSTGRKVMDAMFPRYGVAASIANGMTMGTLPNIQAGVAAGANAAANLVGAGDGQPIGESYDATLQRQQDARRQFDSAHPFVSAAGNAVGGVATGVGLAREGVTLVGRESLPVLGSMVGSGAGQAAKRAAAGAVEGAGYGAAAGFGGGEGGFDNRMRGARDNAALGAGIGAAAPAVIDLASRGARGVRDIVQAVRDPEARADNWIANRLLQDRLTPDDVAASIERAAAQGQPEYMAVDAAGRNTQKLAKAAGRAPGAFRDEATNTLNVRQEGQAGRLGQHVDEALGQVGVGAFNTEQGIVQARRAAAGQHYDAAYAAPPPRGQFYDEMLDRQSVRDALTTVERTAAENQQPLTDLFIEVANPNARTVSRQVPSSVLGPDGQALLRSETSVENPTVRVPTMRGWDQVKRALDTQVDTGFRSADPAQRSLAAAVRETRDQLRQKLADENPAYGQALQRYSDDAASLEAIQTGRDLARARDADAASLAYRELTPGNQDLARAGAAREIGLKLENQGVGADKTRVLSTPNMAQKLDLMSDDPTVQAVFRDRLAREREMASTRRLMTGGSDTAENLAEALDRPGGTALARLAEGRLISAIMHGVGDMASGAARAATGMNEPVARRIGDRLFSADPSRIRSIGDMYAAAAAADAQPAIGSVGVIAGMNAPRQRNGRERR